MLITPERVTPDLGGPYRDRRTGEVGELVFYEPALSWHRGSAVVRVSPAWTWRGGADDLWERFIHAEACHEE